MYIHICFTYIYIYMSEISTLHANTGTFEAAAYWEKKYPFVCVLRQTLCSVASHREMSGPNGGGAGAMLGPGAARPNSGSAGVKKLVIKNLSGVCTLIITSQAYSSTAALVPSLGVMQASELRHNLFPVGLRKQGSPC